jgi:hypothetical protein
MAQVILGGLLSSTFLNLILVPVLFARWGRARDAGAPAFVARAALGLSRAGRDRP